jgi:hypothetical protein
MMNFGFDTHGKLEVFHKYHFSVSFSTGYISRILYTTSALHLFIYCVLALIE